jgi:hypothetical protein
MLLTIKGSPTREQLLEAWENILNENEKENGSYNLANFLRENNYSIQTQANLMRLINANLLLSFGNEYGLTIANECGLMIDKINEETILELRNRISQIITREEINQLSKPEIEEPQSFEEIIVRSSIFLKQDIRRDITVREWNVLHKNIKEIAKAHGR